MIARLARLPLRVRLTLAFAGASAILLAAVGTFIFFEVHSGLDAFSPLPECRVRLSQNMT